VNRLSSTLRRPLFTLVVGGLASISASAFAEEAQEGVAADSDSSVSSETADSSDSSGTDSGDSSSPDSSDSDGTDSGDSSEADSEEVALALPPTMLEAAVGVRMYSRSFRYSDTLAQLYPAGDFTDLPSYSLPLAPMAYVEASYFPLAGTENPILQNIGLTGSFELGFATDVNYAGTTLSQTHYRYDVGLRGRIPIGAFSIQPVVAYGGHNFSIGSPPGGPAPFPSVNYSLIEMGSDVFWRLHPITIRAYGRFLLPLGLGDVGSAAWFPSAKGLGSHWGGEVGFAVSEAFDILVNVDGRIYGLNFNPLPDGTPPEKVAGGATDQYISASLGLGFHFPKTPAPLSE
jgi:hypothetical protein